MAKVSMPQLGESVTEGTIGRWLKQPGEAAGGADGAEAVDGGRRGCAPRVLRLPEQHGIAVEELGRMTGSGLGGRVSKEDVLPYIETRGAAPQPAPQPVGAPPPAAAQPA